MAAVTSNDLNEAWDAIEQADADLRRAFERVRGHPVQNEIRRLRSQLGSTSVSVAEAYRATLGNEQRGTQMGALRPAPILRGRG